MLKTIQVIFSLLMLVSLAGCNVKQAQSPHLVEGAVSADLSGNRVETGAVFFPRTDITFNYTQLFMWKKDGSPSDVAQVLNNTTLLEDTQDQLFTMNERRKVLKAEFDAIQVDIVNYPHQIEEELPSKQSQLTKAQSQSDGLTKQSADIKSRLDDLNKQESPTDEVKQQIADLTQQQEKLTQQIDKLTQKIAHLNEQIAPILAAQKAVMDAKLEGDVDEWKTLDTQITKKQEEASRYLQPINDSVWIFNSTPIHFSFHFDPDHTIHAGIHNWDLSKIDDTEVAETGAPVEFSTDSFTMGHVHYEPVGGVFTFEVYTPKSTYWYKIARTKYDALDGRIHYKGDIVRCTVADGYGRPVIVHVRDFVQCGVDASDADVTPDQVGKPVLRRGAANLVDLDDNS